MAVSRVCYVSRETAKQAGMVGDDAENVRVDRVIQAVTSAFEQKTRTWFIPRSSVQTVTLPLMPATFRNVYGGFWASIPLPAHLQSASSVVLHTSATDQQTLTVTTQYRLSPDRLPYDHIDVLADQIDPIYGYDVVTGWTDYRPFLSITGIWSRWNETVPSGTVNGAINDTVTAMAVSDASLMGVGDSLLIGTEQVLVADRLTNGSLSILRAQGGTTAAAHSDGAATLRYQVPGDVENAVLARVIATIQQELAGYGRVVGTGEGARPYSGKAVMDEWQCAVRDYKRGWTLA